MILHFPTGPTPSLACMDWMLLLPGAEVIGGAQSEQEIAEGLEGESAARRAGVVAPIVLDRKKPPARVLWLPWTQERLSVHE